MNTLILQHRARRRVLAVQSTRFTAHSSLMSRSLTTWRVWRLRRRSTVCSGFVAQTPHISCSAQTVSFPVTSLIRYHNAFEIFCTYWFFFVCFKILYFANFCVFCALDYSAPQFHYYGTSNLKKSFVIWSIDYWVWNIILCLAHYYSLSRKK